MNGWENFLVAQVGASAALAGLLFVGISLNLTKILAGAPLPNRALQALIFLTTILIVSSLLLLPGQTLTLSGIEIFTIGIILLVIMMRLDMRSLRKIEPQYRKYVIQNILLNQVPVFSYILTGIAVIAFGAPGLYGLAPIVIFSFLKAITDAWVLLVEINR